MIPRTPIAEPQAAHGARVLKIPPPAYYVVAFMAGRAASTAVGTQVPDTVVRWGGAILAGVGAALVVGGIAGVVAHRTTIVPHRPVTALVTGGAYAISRNPMYTGLALAYLGLVGVTGSWWSLATLVPALGAIRYLVIAPEERYLEQRFTGEFAAYRGRVRRWL